MVPARGNRFPNLKALGADSAWFGRKRSRGTLYVLRAMGSAEAPAPTASLGLAGFVKVPTTEFWFLLSSSCLPAPDRLHSTASQLIKLFMCLVS